MRNATAFIVSCMCGSLPVVSASADPSLELSANRLADAERGGAYAVAIVEPAVAAASLQQAAGDHVAAAVHLSRAIHLRRIDEGLDTPSQIPLLERLLESQRAIGDATQAESTQERLFVLRLRNNRNPLERLEAVQLYADWHRERYLSGESARPYLHLLAMHEAHAREAEVLARSHETDASVQVAHLYGLLDVEYLVSDYQGARVPALQMRAGEGGTTAFAAATDLEGERFRLMRENNYRNGRTIVARILKLLEESSELSVTAAAKAHIALGDWHMWWNSPALAINSYRQAWRIYAEDDDPETVPESLFEGPVALPVESSLTSRQTPADAARHARARVRFSVSRLGEARAIKMLAVDASHDDGAHLVMRRMIKASRFRPVLENGEPVVAENIERTFSISY